MRSQQPRPPSPDDRLFLASGLEALAEYRKGPSQRVKNALSSQVLIATGTEIKHVAMVDDDAAWRLASDSVQSLLCSKKQVPRHQSDGLTGQAPLVLRSLAKTDSVAKPVAAGTWPKPMTAAPLCSDAPTTSNTVDDKVTEQ